MIDATHDPALVSWVESANDPATDFPIQNSRLVSLVLPLRAHEPASPSATGFSTSLQPLG